MKTTTFKTIEIIVSPKGETRVETIGFAGASCCRASGFIEHTLGKTMDEHLTAEYFAFTNGEQRQQHRH